MAKVKICGLMDPKDVADACAAGADMVGAVVDIPTPRSVTPDQAKILFAAASESVAKAAVMVPRNITHANRTVDEVKPDYLQIHGPISAAELKQIKKTTGVPIIAAVSVPQKIKRPQEIIAQAREVAEAADIISIDTKRAGKAGGTGLTHDWNVTCLVRESIEKPLMLAGGLNPENVKKAIEVVKPYGVDVASGVESELGKKNPELVREFIRAAKELKT